MTKQALGPNQERWLKALESGRYKQGTACLCMRDSYCCLGVACKQIRIRAISMSDGRVAFGKNLCTGNAPREVIEKLALKGETGPLRRKLGVNRSLVGANDNGVSFAEIAAFCRRYPASVFREPR